MISNENVTMWIMCIHMSGSNSSLLIFYTCQIEEVLKESTSTSNGPVQFWALGCNLGNMYITNINSIGTL